MVHRVEQSSSLKTSSQEEGAPGLAALHELLVARRLKNGCAVTIALGKTIPRSAPALFPAAFRHNLRCTILNFRCQVTQGFLYGVCQIGAGLLDSATTRWRYCDSRNKHRDQPPSVHPNNNNNTFFSLTCVNSEIKIWIWYTETLSFRLSFKLCTMSLQNSVFPDSFMIQKWQLIIFVSQWWIKIVRSSVRASLLWSAIIIINSTSCCWWVGGGKIKERNAVLILFRLFECHLFITCVLAMIKA